MKIHQLSKYSVCVLTVGVIAVFLMVFFFNQVVGLIIEGKVIGYFMIVVSPFIAGITALVLGIIGAWHARKLPEVIIALLALIFVAGYSYFIPIFLVSLQM